jgi:hypothetical protein
MVDRVRRVAARARRVTGRARRATAPARRTIEPARRETDQARRPAALADLAPTTTGPGRDPSRSMDRDAPPVRADVRGPITARDPTVRDPTDRDPTDRPGMGRGMDGHPWIVDRPVRGARRVRSARALARTVVRMAHGRRIARPRRPVASGARTVPADRRVAATVRAAHRAEATAPADHRAQATAPADPADHPRTAARVGRARRWRLPCRRPMSSVRMRS